MNTFESTSETPVAWIADQLARLPARPVRRAVVLVAAQRQAHAIRRHICVERAQPAHVAGVLFLRPADLAHEVLARTGTARLAGWEEIRRLRILDLFESGALASQLRYFNAAQLCSGQGYADAFARTIGDLEDSGLDAAVAFAVAQALAPEDRLAADRLHDVAVTWQAADAGRSALGTAAQALAEATAAIRARPEVLQPFGPIFAVLTASPSTMLLRFLHALPACRVVFQEGRPLRTGTQRWRPLMGLATAAAVHEQKQQTTEQVAETELRLLQRFLFQPPEILTDPERPRSAGPDGSVDLEAYAGIEDEVEAAAVWVAEQIAADTALEQIALVVPEIDPYGPLLADRLGRVGSEESGAGVPVYIAGGLSLASSPAGMRVRGLLQALARGLELEATIRILPALRRGDQAKDDPHTRLSPSRAADIVYGAGIAGGSPGDPAGAGEWGPRLRHRRAALRALVDAAEAGTAGVGEGDGRRPARQAIDRQQAQRWLRDVEPILPAVEALQALAENVLAGAPLDTVWHGVRAFCDRWLRLPPDPPDLLALLDRRVQPLLADPVARAIKGAAALCVVMDALQRERRPAARFGDPCVFIGTGAHAAGLPFATVRILGLVEGALPHTPHDDPIVPDSLRARIEEAARARQAEPDIVVPRLADRVLDDIHDVFRMVCGAGRRLALSAPRQWVDRSEREVSGIMLEVATALGRAARSGAGEGDVPTAARLRAAYLNPGRAARLQYAAAHPPSPRALLAAVPLAAVPIAAVPPAAGGPPEPQPLAVPAGWLGGTAASGTAASGTAASGTALALDQLWELAAVRESDALGGIDGVVAGAWEKAPAPGLTPQRPLSASGLTSLLGCPHRFLMERILYLREAAVRPPMDSIAPVTYGALFHAAAERFFRETGAALCRREGAVEQWVACARAIAADEFDVLRHEYPMRGADGIARERDRLLRQTEQLVHYEWGLPPRQFVASEAGFGEPEPVRLEVDGGDLYIRGAIDRVDRLAAGGLSVRDLKTGRVRDLGDDPVNAARDLQLGLYVLALEASGCGAAGGGERVEIAAYVHPSAAQEPDRAFTGAVLDQLRERTREWLGVARALLSSGSFPRTPNPEDCAYCPFVPACGDGAQQRSAAKLGDLPPGHALESFVRFKHRRRDDDE